MSPVSAPTASPARQLAGFMARYDPAIVRLARAAITRMRKLVPGATELVYDNYNALVIGFGPCERPSRAEFSLALFPDHVTLCFLWGRTLPDPKPVLRGGGNQVRWVRLATAADLDRSEIRALIRAGIAQAEPRFDPVAKRRMIIQSISAKQRPRRPVAHRVAARARPTRATKPR